MKPRITVVSPTTMVVPDVTAAFAALWPEAELSQLVDDSIYQDVFFRGTGLTPKIKARVLALLQHGAAADAKAMMFSGSVFGAMIEELRTSVPVPVLTSSEGLIEEAFAAGKQFGLLSSVEASNADLKRDLARYGRQNGLYFSIEREVVPKGARTLIENGDRETHDRMLVEASRQLADIEVVLMPQFSLTSAHAQIPNIPGRTVLCVSRSAISKLKRVIG